jgi:undecaprenyl diphosphate synthase
MDIPKHIGFIMDGNRRWARERGLPTLNGHLAGYELVKQIGPWCAARGVNCVTLFAFSTENWKRAQDEVGYLMDLLMSAVTRDLEIFMKNNFRLKLIGRRTDLSEKLQQAVAAAEERTKDNNGGTMQLAISYGGRDEIVRAAQKASQAGAITEESISQYLDTAGAPDPDLIIRTSGEQRLSGFLLWQAAYSELLFLKKHWPDFSEPDLDAAIAWYSDRERRYGK